MDLLTNTLVSGKMDYFMVGAFTTLNMSVIKATSKTIFFMETVNLSKLISNMREILKRDCLMEKLL